MAKDSLIIFIYIFNEGLEFPITQVMKYSLPHYDR
jgi:hypothetical protein